jgi:hypothetical protein
VIPVRRAVLFSYNLQSLKYEGQVLTFSIVSGWLGMAATLGHWTSLGYPKAVVGSELLVRRRIFIVFINSLFSRLVASALYALTFGMLGLIPAPRIRGQRPD